MTPAILPEEDRSLSRVTLDLAWHEPAVTTIPCGAGKKMFPIFSDILDLFSVMSETDCKERYTRKQEIFGI